MIFISHIYNNLYGPNNLLFFFVWLSQNTLDDWMIIIKLNDYLISLIDVNKKERKMSTNKINMLLYICHHQHHHHHCCCLLFVHFILDHDDSFLMFVDVCVYMVCPCEFKYIHTTDFFLYVLDVHSIPPLPSGSGSCLNTVFFGLVE